MLKSSEDWWPELIKLLFRDFFKVDLSSFKCDPTLFKVGEGDSSTGIDYLSAFDGSLDFLLRLL